MIHICCVRSFTKLLSATLRHELRHWLLGTTSRAMPPSFVTDAVGQHIKMSGIPFGVKLVLY